MPGTDDLVGARKNRIGFLHPRFWIKNVATRPSQLAKAIVIPPTATCGIDDEQLVFVSERLGAFVNQRAAMLLPIVFRTRNANALPTDGQRIAHGGDVEILRNVFRSPRQMAVRSHAHQEPNGWTDLKDLPGSLFCYRFHDRRKVWRKPSPISVTSEVAGVR